MRQGMSAQPCAIWKTQAQVLESAGDFSVFDSPRAGGKYWISGSAITQVLPLNDYAKRLLTTWMCEQRRAGVETPQVRQGVLDLIKSRQPLPIMTRMTFALQYLGASIVQLGDSLTVQENGLNVLNLLAETESTNLKEISQLLLMLKEAGLVEGSLYMGGGGLVRPTIRGWQELDKLKRARSDSSQAFVAMWFSDSTNEAYVEGIQPAILQAGYEPIRIDKKEHNNKIDDEIVAKIRRSRFVVADFTCEPKKVRGGVYYEAGFAQGLGLPVIWTCRDTSLSDLHFDTRQYSHIVWKTPVDLLAQLRNRIVATLGDGPLQRRSA
jgi:hypothetical protein